MDKVKELQTIMPPDKGLSLDEQATFIMEQIKKIAENNIALHKSGNPFTLEGKPPEEEVLRVGEYRFYNEIIGELSE